MNNDGLDQRCNIFCLTGCMNISLILNVYKSLKISRLLQIYLKKIK